MERDRTDAALTHFRHLASSTPVERFADTLKEDVEERVREGHPRDDLYEDLKILVLDLRKDGNEELEEAALEVMDVLVGWCAPSARL